MPRLRLLVPAAVVLAGLVAVLAALEFGGGAVPLPIADAGASVRYGIPIARMLQDIATAGTLGGLVFACYALRPGGDAWNRSLDIAAASAAVGTVASAAVAWLSFRTLVTGDLSVDERFTSAFIQFFTQVEAGQYLLWTTVTTALLASALVVVRSSTGAFLLAAASGIPLIFIAAAGHSGGTETHTIAVSGLWLHIVFAAVWLGGLAHLAVLRLDKRPSFEDALRRYSSLALVSFAVVAFSGVVSAWVRVGSWEAITTPYGVLVIVKTGLLVALGCFGAWQRRALIGRGPEARTRWFFIAELAFMGLAMGVANGLARTPTPVNEVSAADAEGSTPAAILTGSPLPPPIEPIRFLTEWSIDPLWIVVCVCLAGFYAVGVWRMHRRGDRWPVLRTVSWMLGVALLAWCTNGALNVYQEFTFSMHMLVHMLLGMAVPVLLVPGAPITLAMRSIAKRQDGTRGGREWLLWIVHTRYMQIVGKPLVSAGIFVGSLWLFYYTGIFRWAMENHLGHVWMVVHFVGAGYLFVQAIIGIDPAPARPPYPMRLMLLLGSMVFHAFFGLTIMTGGSLLLADWFGAMGNGVDALADQRIGGGIAWSVGELPTLALALVTTMMWIRSDKKEQRRIDRRADRDGDAELAAYNEMLERMADRP